MGDFQTVCHKGSLSQKKLVSFRLQVASFADPDEDVKQTLTDLKTPVLQFLCASVQALDHTQD